LNSFTLRFGLTAQIKTSSATAKMAVQQLWLS